MTSLNTVHIHILHFQGLIQRTKRGVAKVPHKVQCNYPVIYYSLGHVNSIHVLLQLSVFYHYHEENEASYAVWLSCSKYVDYSLSEWLICVSSNTLFTRMLTRICSCNSESARISSYYGHCTPKGVASYPIHSTPPGLAPDFTLVSGNLAHEARP